LGDERLGLDFLLENNNHALRVSTGNRTEPSSSGTHPIPPAYSILPRTTAPSCPLDTLLLDFLVRTQRLAAEGVPTRELSGPAYPNFNMLVNPKTQVDTHPLSKFLMDIIHTFPDVVHLPEQVGIVYIMFLILRWQVEPTQENYERMPEWVQPRPPQLLTPHPQWMDYLPW
jgi:hypothetical protein